MCGPGRRPSRGAGEGSRRGHTCSSTCSQTELPLLVGRASPAPVSGVRGITTLGAEAGPFTRYQGGCGLGTPAVQPGHQGFRRRGRGGRAGQRARPGPNGPDGPCPDGPCPDGPCPDGPDPAAGSGGDGEALGSVLGDLAHGRLAGPGRAAGVVQPPAVHAAGQPGRDRVPGRGAGARGRARRRPVRLDPVPGRLSAADHAGLLVHQQSLDRLPRRAGDQRRDQRAGTAARLHSLPQARARPPGRVCRGHRGGAGPRRVLLQPVRDDQRGLPGSHAGLAADHAQLAHRIVRAGPVRGRGRFRAAGHVRLRDALAGPGDAGRPGRGGRAHLLAAGCRPAQRAGRRLDRGGHRGRRLVAEPSHQRGHLPGGNAQPVRPDPAAAGQRERHDPRARDGGRPTVAAGARQLGHRGHRPGRRAGGDRAPRRAERPADHGRPRGGGHHRSSPAPPRPRCPPTSRRPGRPGATWTA